MKRLIDGRTEAHEQGMPLYVSATTRKCVSCPEEKNVHNVKRFVPAIDGTISTQCRACLAEENRFNSATTERKVSEYFDKMTKTLSAANKRDPDTVPVNQILQKLHGTISERSKIDTFARVGRVYRRALTRATKQEATQAELELGVKVGNALVRQAIEVEKKNSQSVDLSDLSEDELIDILIEPARQLILNNEKFRAELLGMEDIRRVLLIDAGVELLEGAPV